MFTKEEKIIIEKRKKNIKAGMRIKCIEMLDDPRPIESGATGIVICVDDAGQIHVAWDSGRTLALALIDKYEVIGENK